MVLILVSHQLTQFYILILEKKDNENEQKLQKL